MINGFIPASRFLPFLTWQDVQCLPDRENTVIIQPVGAIEQHGPHLPLVTDAAVLTGVLGAALEQLPSHIPAYCMAPLHYGKSNEHWHFPGTISLSAETLLHTLMEVGHSVYRAGLRKLILANGHGGQPQVVEIAARELRLAYPDMTVFPLFLWSVPHNGEELMSPRELKEGIHGGDAETSVMLALLPDQVKMVLAATEYPPLPPMELLSVEGPLPFAWVTRDLSASGVIGDPTAASLEKGKQLLDSLAVGWVRVIAEIHRFRMPAPEPVRAGSPASRGDRP